MSQVQNRTCTPPSKNAAQGATPGLQRDTRRVVCSTSLAWSGRDTTRGNRSDPSSRAPGDQGGAVWQEQPAARVISQPAVAVAGCSRSRLKDPRRTCRDDPNFTSQQPHWQLQLEGRSLREREQHDRVEGVAACGD
ncbi:MAG: hypothetical protein R3B96_21400 [Pirellulaceae bacterium]|nr:hypothetical protein [Planctomycetales bacterium]